MSVRISTGKEGRAIALQEIVQVLRQLSVGVEKTILLNGGSDTRRAAREFYQEVYGSSRAFTVTSNAFSVTIRARKDAGP